jgi:hypothetical protein
MSIQHTIGTPATSEQKARKALLAKYFNRIHVNPALTRSIVSYQSNRKRPFYRWFKYKEGFSAALVEHIVRNWASQHGSLLDPFAGSGAALLAAREAGWQTEGIELLPVGVFFVRARLAAERVRLRDFRAAIASVRSNCWRKDADPELAFQHLRITNGAFPAETEEQLTYFRTYLRDHISDGDVRLLMEAACLAVLEDVSFTRKDGQYLRWDERAPREWKGKRFNKGQVPSFELALLRQLEMMYEDVSGGDLFDNLQFGEQSEPVMRQGSCLNDLPHLPDDSFDLVITSPPYCNRYDYSRTYALELAFLGVDEVQLKALRQGLLSCTVENRSKLEQLRTQYKTLRQASLFDRSITAFEKQEALQEVLAILERRRNEGALNNDNVPRMVRNYFLESSLVIHELARVVKASGQVVMVNDNVQYAGEEVPVDLILCEFAEAAGFKTEHVWTLSRGKGNSSQQMGAHGRNELRKCAYLWRLQA